MKRWQKVAIVSGVTVMLLAIGLGPFSLMLVPNPEPLKVSSISDYGRGTYVEARGATFKLFPHASLLREFPKDAFVAAPEVRIFVKARQFDRMEGYSVTRFGEGRPVAVRRDLLPDRVLRMKPVENLAPGRYVVSVSRDDMWGGTDYFYLHVK